MKKFSSDFVRFAIAGICLYLPATDCRRQTENIMRVSANALRLYSFGLLVVKLYRRNALRAFIQAKADGNGIIDLLHKYVVNMSHFFSESGFVNGTYLFQKNDGILDETEAFGVYVNMRR